MEADCRQGFGMNTPLDITQDEFWSDARIAPAALSAHPRNPRTHSPEQIEEIRALIRELGFTRPVLCTHELVLLAGHGATIAAELEGLADIPARIRSRDHPLTEAQELALLISDNKSTLRGGWDQRELAAILGELKAEEYPLDLTCFQEFEIAQLLDPTAPASNAAGAHWTGMPQFENPNNCFRKIIVNFASQADVDEFFRRIGQEGTELTRSIWYPHVERRDLEAQRWT